MNYLNIYTKLIENAKTNPPSGHTEIHHIVPRCIGGTDSYDNLVKLSPEAHYLAHQLLVKIYPGNKKLIYAAHMMTVTSVDCPRNNKSYGWLRRQMAESMSGPGNPMFGRKYSDERKALSGRSGVQNRMYGKHHSEQTKKLLSEKNKGQPGLVGPANGMFGKEHSDQTKKLISENNPWRGTAGTGTHPNTGRKMSETNKEHLRKLFTGVKMKEETKQKLKKPKGPQLIVTCPQCGKIGGVSNLTRYHFNNCKNK